MITNGSKIGLFIDPSLSTGVAVIDMATKLVLRLESISLRGLTDQIQTYLGGRVKELMNEYDVDFVAMEYINTVYARNVMFNHELNVLYKLAVKSVVKDVPLYFISNPAIRSRLLDLVRKTDPSFHTTSLKKHVIRDLMMCEFDVSKVKFVRSNYNLSDAMAVAYAYRCLEETKDLNGVSLITECLSTNSKFVGGRSNSGKPYTKLPKLKTNV